jgi:hypothetical protein
MAKVVFLESAEMVNLALKVNNRYSKYSFCHSLMTYEGKLT